MITGRLPFPDAKGPAGLITAQLKQTPQPPSDGEREVVAEHAAGRCDRVILKCLEKDKNNRYADVSALAAALQEVIDAREQRARGGAARRERVVERHRLAPPDMLETRRGEMPHDGSPPPMPQMNQAAPGGSGMMRDGTAARRAAGAAPHAAFAAAAAIVSDGGQPAAAAATVSDGAQPAADGQPGRDASAGVDDARHELGEVVVVDRSRCSRSVRPPARCSRS